MDQNTTIRPAGAVNTPGSWPLVFDVPATADVRQWCSDHATLVDAMLNQHGALLLRGMDISGSKKLAVCLELLFGDALMGYQYRSTPRTRLRDNIYTSTEYHSEAVIVQHNECAYARQWPLRIGFHCVKASAQGGETPICDSGRLLQLLPPELVDEFERKQLKYIRNYSEFDLPWTEVFQTDNSAEVDDYCQRHQIERQWLDDGTLRTWQVNPAVVRHPVSGLRLWFNQAHLFHPSTLPVTQYQQLRSLYTEESLPRNVCFGDGSPIPAESIALINQLYLEQMVVFQWQDGDLLLLDNMRCTHGRLPFSGERKVLVGMARPWELADIMS